MLTGSRAPFEVSFLPGVKISPGFFSGLGSSTLGSSTLGVVSGLAPESVLLEPVLVRVVFLEDFEDPSGMRLASRTSEPLCLRVTSLVQSLYPCAVTATE